MMAALSLASVLIARFEGLSLQIAVLRAIGYSRGELSSWLLLEGLLLGAFACTMGAIIDAAVFPFLRAAFASALPFQTPSSILESAPIWAAALAATVLSVAIPIIRAYRQDVHNALRA
jgi:putative ABC transport system permease protein